MKKIIFLTAMLLSGFLSVSCDNEQDAMSKQSFATDDGFTPIKPPPPPPKVINPK